MRRRAACLAAAALALGACSSATITPRPNRAEEFLPWTADAGEYRFAPGDRLRIGFLRTPELNETALVAPDGAIVLRATGRVPAVGRTAQEMQEAIAAAAQRVLIEPVVTVALEEAGGAQVVVGGSVRTPGAYPLVGRRGALEMVLVAGGFDPEARMDQVVLIRRGPGDRPMVRTIDVRAFVEGREGTGDVPLFPGDIVYVPRSRVAEAGLWVDQNINRIVPFSRSFSYSLNRAGTNVGF